MVLCYYNIAFIEKLTQAILECGSPVLHYLQKFE